MFKTLFIIGLAIVIAIYISKKKSSPNKPKEVKYTTSTIEGELKMMDVVSYFKSLDLSQDKDTPFIAKGSHEMFKHYFNIEIEKEGYLTFVLGTYEEKIEELQHVKILFCKDIDSQLKDVLGNETFVVLS